MVTFTLSYSDPTGRFSAQAPTIQADVLAAAQTVGKWLPGAAELAISVTIDSTISTANGGAGSVVPTGTENGIRIVTSAAAAELVSGKDVNGETPEIMIRVGADALSSLYWLDATPQTSNDIPSNGYDFVSAMEHEILHALGFSGFRDWVTGTLTGTLEEPYDRWVQTIGGKNWFTGPTAVAVYGGNVPLHDSNVYHYASASSARTGLLDGLMNGNGRSFGKRYDLNDLDLAMLQDSGVPINRPVTGTDAGEALSSVLQGTFTALGGNDVITGSTRADTIDGGAGRDTAVYGSARASYRITSDGSARTVASVAGTEGSDTLVNVERVRFADGSVAFDMDGNAGIAAKLVGALLGRDFLASKGVVGVVLGLLDGGTTELNLAAMAAAHPLVESLAGSHSNRDFVQLILKNVTGSAPAATLDSLTALLDNGTFTQATFGAFAAEHPLNIAHVDLVGLAQAGLDYT